ncbi:MAG: hypothetical protein IJX64_06370 [Clostridia bacterium]|nr:hypothetical protein [Clostridia bacterium]
MENRNDKEAFHYTYSAKEQEEIKNIRKKYAPAEEDQMTQLRRLDAGVYQKATAVSLVVGVIGALLLGIGMCCTMVWQDILFIPGIAVGLVGILTVCLAYPLYNRTLKKERERIAPEIIRLTDALMK